jgi:hypothetical protein
MSDYYKTVPKSTGEKPGLLDRVSPEAKVAAGLGTGAVGWFYGPTILVPVGVAFAGYTGWKWWKHKRCLTPERRKVYEQALMELKDPAKLRALADVFSKVGCHDQAEHLRKRAELRERSPEQKQQDRALYKSAMKSTDPGKVQKAAVYFKGIGADGTAANLETRVKALKLTVKPSFLSMFAPKKEPGRITLRKDAGYTPPKVY